MPRRTLRLKQPRRRKYQHTNRKTTQPKNNKFQRRRRVMIGGFDDAFISYIHAEISHIRKMATKANSGDSYGLMLRAIPSGGSFTNKMDGNGRFNQDVDLNLLLHNTRLFWKYTDMINKKTATEFPNVSSQPPIVIYRHVNIPVDLVHTIHIGKRIIQPIPMSCTWSIDFAIGWMNELHNSCCLYEITIPATAAFLPLSTHPTMPMPPSNDVPLNQLQFEVTVAPCILTCTGMRRHNDIHVFQFTAETCKSDDEVIRNFNHVIDNGSL